MGQGPGARGTTVNGAAATPEELRREIERTRLELGETVAALAEKTDVKARAREKADEVRETVMQKRTELIDRARESSPDGATSAAVQLRGKAQENPLALAAAAALAGGFILGRITGRKRD
jgi:hypothetical protein